MSGGKHLLSDALVQVAQLLAGLAVAIQHTHRLQRTPRLPQERLHTSVTHTVTIDADHNLLCETLISILVLQWHAAVCGRMAVMEP